MRKSFLSVILVSFLTLGLAAILTRVTPDAAAAPTPQTTPAACSALDVVFLIDQSDSMSGANGGIPTDPSEQRKFATQAVIDLLTDIALDQCPHIIHRVAVVSYGTDAQIDLPLSEINPEDFNAADELRQRLKANVDAIELGQTNPRAAFAAAADILNGAAPIGQETRKRVIIFITDGLPCIAADGCGADPNYSPAAEAIRVRNQVAADLPFDDTLLEREACLQALRSQTDPEEELAVEAVNNCLETHPVTPEAYQNSTYIWTVLLRFGQAYPTNVRDQFVAITDSHGGQVVDLSANRQDIPTTFRNILEQLAGVRAARLQCGAFAVNPYLERARLVFYKFDESVVVQLSYTDVGGQVHTLANNEHDGGFDVLQYYRQGANERYEVYRPYPGIWRLESENCDGLDAFYDPIAVNPGGWQNTLPSAIAQRDRDPFYDEAAPIYLAYQMNDQAGNVIPQADHPHFHVSIEATVTDPAGNERTIPMEWVESELLFRATEPLLVPTSGRYAVHLRGVTREHEGEPAPVGNLYREVFDTERVLFDASDEFTVFPVRSFSIEILAPTSGEALIPVHGQATEEGPPPVQPIAVRARLVPRPGEPALDISQVLPEPNNALTARVTAGGQSASALLRADPGAPGEFTGAITGFDVAGEHELVVELTGEFHQEYYPDNRADEVTFSRNDYTWRFNVVSPAAGEDLRPIHGTIFDGWPLPVQPLPVRAQLVDADGEAYPAGDPALDVAPTVLTATLTASEERRSLTLTADPNAPGEYVGQVENLDTAGEHRLLVDVGLSYPQFTPSSEAAARHFTRSDALWNLPGTYFVILALIILFILLNIRRFFAIRSHPVTGTLVFTDQSATAAEFNLHSGKNWTVIKPKVLRNYPQLELKRIKVENLARARRSRSANGDDSLANDFTMPVEDGNMVRMEYTTDSGQKDSVQLSPELPTSYGDTLFQVIYKPATEY